MVVWTDMPTKKVGRVRGCVEIERDEGRKRREERVSTYPKRLFISALGPSLFRLFNIYLTLSVIHVLLCSSYP